MMPDPDASFARQPDLTFERRELTEFLGYWRSKRRGRDFPRRADIRPREIEHLLPWVHMYDTGSDDGEYFVRLLGTSLSHASRDDWGDLRSKPISAYPTRLARRVRLGIEWVLEKRGPVRIIAASAGIPGQEFQGMETCAVPLSDNGRDINIVMAVSILENRNID